MELETGLKKTDAPFPDVASACNLIAQIQKPSGEIPWYVGGKTDPWDHVESAMGLTIGGRIDEARAAFDWLRATQLADGSWYAAYQDGHPEDETRDTNMTSYVAVGVYHHFLVTGDLDFLNAMWPTIKAAMAFAISFQRSGGEIHWAKSPEGVVDPMALLTGSSSVYMSLKCAIAIGERLGHTMPLWRHAMYKLGDAISNRPHLFNVAKSRYSMDWFYPILCGAVQGAGARRRLDKYWKKFVKQGLGVRCVSDEPWITLAETSELVLALAAMGKPELGRIVFSWFQDKRFEDETYWAGFTFPNMVTWPEEKISWTNAVVLMAADALYRITPAADLFNHKSWRESGIGIAPAGKELQRILDAYPN